MRRGNFKSYGVIGLQLVGLLLVAAMLVPVWGEAGFGSAILGGVAWLVPASYFHWEFQRIRPKMERKRMIRWFFFAEVIKLLLSFLMVAFILLVVSVQAVGFLGGYITMVVLSILVPWVTKCYE